MHGGNLKLIEEPFFFRNVTFIQMFYHFNIISLFKNIFLANIFLTNVFLSNIFLTIIFLSKIFLTKYF
jgi:hypothetical protein